MRRPLLSLWCAFLLAPLALACGSDREERGLTPAVEAAAPADADEMAMTEKERREKEAREDDEASRKQFGEQ